MTNWHPKATLLVEVRMCESSGYRWAGLLPEQRTNLIIAFSPKANSQPSRDKTAMARVVDALVSSSF